MISIHSILNRLLDLIKFKASSFCCIMCNVEHHQYLNDILSSQSKQTPHKYSLSHLCNNLLGMYHRDTQPQFSQQLDLKLWDSNNNGHHISNILMMSKKHNLEIYQNTLCKSQMINHNIEYKGKTLARIRLGPRIVACIILHVLST